MYKIVKYILKNQIVLNIKPNEMNANDVALVKTL